MCYLFGKSLEVSQLNVINVIKLVVMFVPMQVLVSFYEVDV